MPRNSLGIRKPGFKHLHLALQGFGQQLLGLLEAFGPQQIAHVHSVQLFERHAKPGLVGLVAKAVVEVHIPRADQRRMLCKMLLMSRSARCSCALTAWRRCSSRLKSTASAMDASMSAKVNSPSPQAERFHF